MFSLLWSEHCAYKHSRKLLGKLPTDGPRVVMGPGENAGAVDVGSGYAVAFKVESHNHPSAVEPFQGAATGVGGILRDVFAIGARPIAILDSLRFGELDSVRSRHLLDGAVRGIGHYGNSIGVPNVGGEIYFEEPYEHNCLVNAMCIGFAKTEEMVRAAAAGVGNTVVLMGATTGRDGIGGASRAGLRRARRGRRREAPDGPGRRPLRGVEGARVLPRAAGEGAARLAAGPRRRGPHLLGGRDGLGGRGRDRHRRRRGAAARGRHGALRDHGQSSPRSGCWRWSSRPASPRCGRSATSGRPARRRSASSPTPARSASSRPARSSATCRSRRWSTAARCMTSSPRRPPPGSTATRETLAPSADSAATLLALLAAPSIASKRWIFQQYDSVVGSRTVRRPESADAAVLQLPEAGNAIARLDRRQRPAGRLRALQRHGRGGARVRPEPRLRRRRAARPDQLPELRQPGEAGPGLAARPRDQRPRVGLRAARRAGRRRQRLALQRGPRRADLPDPGGGDGRRAARPGADRAELLRQRRATRSASSVLSRRPCRARRSPSSAASWQLGLPAPDVAAVAAACATVRDAVRAGRVASAHDVSDGGLACALAECSIGAGIGCRADLQELRERGCSPEEALFGEGPGGFVLSGERAELEALGARVIGAVGGSTIELAAGDRSLVVGLTEVTEAWRSLDARAESVAEPPADA